MLIRFERFGRQCNRPHRTFPKDFNLRCIEHAVVQTPELESISYQCSVDLMYGSSGMLRLIQPNRFAQATDTDASTFQVPFQQIPLKRKESEEPGRRTSRNLDTAFQRSDHGVIKHHVGESQFLGKPCHFLRVLACAKCLPRRSVVNLAGAEAAIST